MGMRRQGYRLYATSLALLLLAACSSQDSAWGDGDETADRRPLAVASLQAPVSSPQTRVTTSPLPADGEVGFFVLAGGSYAAVTNKKGVYKADEGLWLPTDSIWLSRDAAKLALYYPYDASQTTAGKLNLPAMVRPADGSKDLSSARFQADSHTKDISLTLTQLYTRLSVTFVKIADAEYTGTSSLTALKLEGAGVYPTATYTFADGAYTYGNTTGYTATLNPAVTITGVNAAAADATKVDLLLPPYQTLTQDLTFTVTVDTKEMKIVIPKAKLNNTLTAGKQYNITVKLKPTALVLDENSIKITEWDSRTAFNEEAKMENGPIEYVDIGLDFVIAPGNLIATADGNGGYTYAFAEDQGYYSGSSASGDYFRWNTLDPTATVTSNTTYVWDDSNDPCRQVKGGEWHTPTEENLNALNHGTPGGQQDVLLQVRGTYRTKSGKEVRGYYFGTATALSEANQDECVFLPMAGWYDESNAWQDWTVDAWGMYWSATPYGSDWAYRLVISYDYGTDVGTSLWYNAYYNCGIPLRCVRDK